MDRSIAIQERQEVQQLQDQRDQLQQQAQAKAQAALDLADQPKKLLEEGLGGPLVGEAMNRVLTSKYVRKGLSYVDITENDINQLSKIGSKEDLLNFIKKKGAGKASKLIEQLKAKSRSLKLSDAVQNKIQSLPDKTDGKATKVDGSDPVVDDTDDILSKAKELDDRYDNLTDEGKSFVDGTPGTSEEMNDMQDVRNTLVNREQAIQIQEDAMETRTQPSLPEVDNPNSVFDDMTDTPKAVNNLPSKPSIFSNTDNILSDADKTGTDLANSASDALKKGASDLASSADDVVTGAMSDLAEGAVASGGGIDPITDAIGLIAGLGSVLAGAFDSPGVAKVAQLPRIGSTYTAGVF